MTTVNWTIAAGGNFDSQFSWSPTHAPVAGDIANITNTFAGADYSVSVTNAQAAARVNIGADNADFAVAGGVLSVGSIDLTHGTLSVVGGGEITGDTTITDGAGTSTRFIDGTLDGVTWRGTLALTGVTQSSLLTITGSLDVQNEAGNGPGEIDLTGSGAELNFDSTMTINGTGGNLLINIGTSSAQNQFLGVGSTAVLTLGSAVSLNQIAAGSSIEVSDDGGSPGGTIINDGTISLTSGTGSGALFDPSNFVNNGTISLVGGGLPAAAGEDLELTPHDSFADGASGKILVSDFGLVHINGPNGSVDVSGTIEISGTSTVDLDTASVAVSDKSGTGAILVSTGSTIDINDDYQGLVTFLDPTGVLALNQPSNYTGTVAGLSRIDSGTLDVIDLLAVNSVTTLLPIFTSPAGGTLVVLDNTTTLASINLLGNYVGQAFGFAPDGQSTTGTDIFLGCFAAGSRILTDRGEVPVERLREGDLAVTASGEGAVCKPVRWIGVSRIDLARHPRPLAVTPIRIAAGAFGDDLPRRDLWLSPDHAVFVDGVLIPIVHLVNGTTIRREAVGEVVTYYHVELDAHDVLLANGLPAESYLDTGNRADFVNGGGVQALHPDFVARRWESKGCAPLIVTGPTLWAVRDRVNGRAASVTVAAA